MVRLRDEMVRILKRTGAAGISAPQLGENIQFAVVKLSSGGFLELINPEITKMYGVETEEPEGCLSCPPFGNVCATPRMQIIHVRSGVFGPWNRFALSGGVLHELWGEKRFKGLDSRIIQHEIDHLSGTFFFDRASAKARDQVMKQFREWRKNRILQKFEGDKACQQHQQQRVRKFY